MRYQITTYDFLGAMDREYIVMNSHNLKIDLDRLGNDIAKGSIDRFEVKALDSD